jgi:hypothetical protein
MANNAVDGIVIRIAMFLSKLSSQNKSKIRGNSTKKSIHTEQKRDQNPAYIRFPSDMIGRNSVIFSLSDNAYTGRIKWATDGNVDGQRCEFLPAFFTKLTINPPALTVNYK